MEQSDNLNTIHSLINLSNVRDARFTRPITNLDGKDIYSDALHANLSTILVAMQARRGDEAAIELCKAVELVISGTGDKPWFDYRDLG